jgi:methylated-DNA-protein-cysteine methyltransferase-like protein
MSFYDRVYEVVRKIPKGKVMTYGQIAVALGSPRASRAVGYALHFNPAPGIIPCHRVVNRDGCLSGAFAFGGLNEQKRLLENEGVTVAGDKVDLSVFRFNP